MRRMLVVVLAAALTIPPSSPRRAESATLEGVGMSMPTIVCSFSRPPSHSLDEVMRSMAAAGVGAVRYDVHWADVESRPAVYDFSAAEQVVGAATRRGLEILGLLAYGNPLYSKAGAVAAAAGLGAARLFPPDAENLARYEAFARAAARRFAKRVGRWEVWNEENAGVRFWLPHGDPRAYAALLRAGSAGLRTGDRRAMVSLGGLFYPESLVEEGGLRYLGHVYDADPKIGDAIDAVAWHPYTYPFVAPEVVLPANYFSDVPGTADQIRDLLARRKDADTQLWMTELGWPTHGEYGVTPERQAAYLVRGFAALWAEGVPLLTWFTYADGPNADHFQEDAFGLFTFGGEPKPAYVALKTFTSVLRDDVFAGSRADALRLGPDEHALTFEGPRERVTLLWVSPETQMTDYGYVDSTDDVRRTVVVPVRGRVRLLSMTGEVTDLKVAGRRVRLEISPFPVYLIERAA